MSRAAEGHPLPNSLYPPTQNPVRRPSSSPPFLGSMPRLRGHHRVCLDGLGGVVGKAGVAELKRTVITECLRAWLQTHTRQCRRIVGAGALLRKCWTRCWLSITDRRSSCWGWVPLQAPWWYVGGCGATDGRSREGGDGPRSALRACNMPQARFRYRPIAPGTWLMSPAAVDVAVCGCCRGFGRQLTTCSNSSSR